MEPLEQQGARPGGRPRPAGEPAWDLPAGHTGQPGLGAGHPPEPPGHPPEPPGLEPGLGQPGGRPPRRAARPRARPGPAWGPACQLHCLLPSWSISDNRLFFLFA